MRPPHSAAAAACACTTVFAGCQSFTATSYAPSGSSADPRPTATSLDQPTPTAYAQSSNDQRGLSGPHGSSLGFAFDPSETGYSVALRHAVPSEAPIGVADRNTPNANQITYTFDGADFDPMVSADGSVILYASTQHRPTPDIYLKHVGSSVIRQLTNDASSNAMPALSPDGNRVAFCSDRSGNWDIYVMPVGGGPAVQITTDSSHDIHPSWSPDGTRLVFGRLGQTTRRWEMWVVDASSPTVSEFIGFGMFPEWCPIAGTGENGLDKILFQRSRERGDRAFGLWTLDYGNGRVGNLTQIIASPLSAFINASWAPDGKHIAFATVPTPAAWSDASAARPPRAELWMMPVTGGARVALTSGDAVDLMPTWGPDNRIYFVSDRSGSDNIWSMDLSPAILAITGSEPASRSVITGSGTRTITLERDQPLANVRERE